MASSRPEVILCDTSFLGHVERRERNAGRYAHWPSDVLDRLDAGILAVTSFSLAEIHAGRTADRWGERRIEEQDQRLSGLLLIPLDQATVGTWAELRADGLLNGWSVGDNDLWIAATAISRALPLVSCDSGHQRIPRLDLIFLPAPA